jgi:hypothetical protein
MRLEDFVLSNNVLESTKELEMPQYLLEDTEVVGYPDLEMQNELYAYATERVLSAFLDPTHPVAVVDIGAGRGDFKAFLDKLKIGYQYFGYEINPIHRDIAKQKYNLILSDQEFSTCNMNFDGWGFCIGSLNQNYGLFDPTSPESKYSYFRTLLDTCLKCISKGVVFILLNEGTDLLIPFPIPEMVQILDDSYTNLAYTIDYSHFHGIYKLVIYNQRLIA